MERPLAKLTIETREGVETLVSDRPMHRQGEPGIFGALGPPGSYVLETDRGWMAFTVEELVAIAKDEAGT